MWKIRSMKSTRPPFPSLDHGGLLRLLRLLPRGARIEEGVEHPSVPWLGLAVIHLFLLGRHPGRLVPVGTGCGRCLVYMPAPPVGEFLEAAPVAHLRVVDLLDALDRV